MDSTPLVCRESGVHRPSRLFVPSPSLSNLNRITPSILPTRFDKSLLLLVLPGACFEAHQKQDGRTLRSGRELNRRGQGTVFRCHHEAVVAFGRTSPNF